jgi:predicted enzyme related to lactoylglutathione lyase
MRNILIGKAEWKLKIIESPIKNRIHTIFVHVEDLSRSVKWYCDLLGQEYDESMVIEPVYNIPISDYTGLTLDSGPSGKKKAIVPSPHPLFNVHTEDIQRAYDFVREIGYDICSPIFDFDEFSFFHVKDPDGNVVMVCTG